MMSRCCGSNIYIHHVSDGDGFYTCSACNFPCVMINIRHKQGHQSHDDRRNASQVEAFVD
jgi:hypothetical protein